MKELVKSTGALAGLGVGIFFGLYAYSAVSEPDIQFGALAGLIAAAAFVFMLDQTVDGIEWALIKIHVVRPAVPAITETCQKCDGKGDVFMSGPCTECEGEGTRLTALGLALASPLTDCASG